MAATAKEGDKFLKEEKEREEKAEEKQEEKEEKEKAAEEKAETTTAKRGRRKKEESPTKLKRTGTMAATAEEGEAFVKKSPGRKSPRGGKK